ncbi:MAG: hypothetical protein KIS96_11050 [Bauldia sp.]|nr:hypothetical protein [Bauldia sp.]
MTRSASSVGAAAILSTTPILREEPVALALLELIGAVEAPGGYDQRYGEPSGGPFRHRLTAMTLDAVIALPANRPPGRVASTASGRYQFLSGTLRGLKAQLGLSGGERFDPALQDRLAYQLILNRGYRQWQAGTIGDVAFARRLAQEWASLPVLAATDGHSRKVAAGQSYYAGDGTNRALVTPAQIRAALAHFAVPAAEPAVAPAPPDLSQNPGCRGVLRTLLARFRRRADAPR